MSNPPLKSNAVKIWDRSVYRMGFGASKPIRNKKER